MRYYLGRLSSLGLSSSDSLQNSHPLPWVGFPLPSFRGKGFGGWIPNKICGPKVLEGSNKIEIWVLRVQFVTPNPNFMDDCKGKSLKIQPIDFSIISSPPPHYEQVNDPCIPGGFPPQQDFFRSQDFFRPNPHWGSLTGWFSTANTSGDPKDGEPGRLLGAAWCHSHNKVQLSAAFWVATWWAPKWGGKKMRMNTQMKRNTQMSARSTSEWGGIQFNLL